MLVIGVRSSWLTDDTKVSLARSSSWSCWTARRSVSSASSNACRAATSSATSADVQTQPALSPWESRIGLSVIACVRSVPSLRRKLMWVPAWPGWASRIATNPNSSGTPSSAALADTACGVWSIEVGRPRTSSGV